MKTEPFVVRASDRDPLNVIGCAVRVLVSDGDARDLQITLQTGAEGMGPPPHSHDWDESFFVTKGQVNFQHGDESTVCTPGMLVHVPAGNVHAFQFGPEGGEMLEITGKASQAVRMFTEIDREVPPGPPDVAKVVQVLAEKGVRVGA